MGGELTFAEILGALSHALDLTEGLPRGHAVRTAYIALRIGQELRFTETELRDLYKACLLKDVGCSACAVRLYKAFAADDILVKRNARFYDLSNPVETLRFTLGYLIKGRTLIDKLINAIRHRRDSAELFREMKRARCVRGAEIAHYIGFTQAVADAIEYLDEHWDGNGYPYGLEGEQIPLLARIVNLSQTIEVFAATFGVDAAYEMARQRSGRWFDPFLVCVAERFQPDRAFWGVHAEMLRNPELRPPVPDFTRRVAPTDIDRVCEAFAQVVDAKSTFTADHSRRVAYYAVQLAEALGWDAEQVRFIYRAALLHDIGKLGVPTSILEKPGKLTDDEFAQVRKHPQYTYEILRCIRTFEWMAEVAGAHHERLDGRGYWRGLSAEQLTPEMRILAVADVFDALHAERPYRPALPLEQVLEIMERESGAALDGELVQILKSVQMETPLAQAA